MIHLTEERQVTVIKYLFVWPAGDVHSREGVDSQAAADSEAAL